jgi:hypothetical protein
LLVRIKRLKITTLARYDKDWNLLEEESFEYDGPIARLGGGPSAAQTAAASSQAANEATEAQTAATDSARQTTAYNAISPFATNLMTNGMPSYGDMTDWAGGNSATAYAQARGALNRQLSSIGSLPSGFKTAQNADLNENEAQNFDQGLQTAQNNQLAAKMQGANIINGLQTTYNPVAADTAANTANSSIMNAPLQTPSAMGVLGGLIGAGAQLGSAAITASCPAKGSLYLMADGSEKPVEELKVGHLLRGIDGEPQVIEEIHSARTPVLRVTTEDGFTARNSRVHAYALPVGGFVVAAHSLGKNILTALGVAKIMSVQPDGEDLVFNIITDGSHTYRADGVWALGVGEAERHVSMEQWDEIGKRVLEKAA